MGVYFNFASKFAVGEIVCSCHQLASCSTFELSIKQFLFVCLCDIVLGLRMCANQYPIFMNSFVIGFLLICGIIFVIAGYSQKIIKIQRLLV